MLKNYWLLAKRKHTALLPLLLCLQQVMSQNLYPGKHWKQYQDPNQASWSTSSLAETKRYSDSIGLAAVMIVYKGVVLANWGDIERKYLCHSIRKSFLSALYGMSVRDGQININNTLEQLDLDDTVHPLTLAEKQATARELLEGRSGIYLPAAYEGNPEKPARGSHPHGSFWLYNNWDFNALGTILQKKTGQPFFEDLQQRICLPLHMEDVDSLDIFYDYDRSRSSIPAYTFKMSTRDLARFGLLYLNNGKWEEKQLVPAEWVSESTRSFSISDEPEYGYGYLWWIDNLQFKNRGMYCAAGKGGHRIYVFPKDDLVVVVRTDTYENKSVDNKYEFKLLSMILDGKTGAGVPTPDLMDLLPVPREPPTGYAPKLIPENYLGKFRFNGEWMTIYQGKKGLMMDAQLMGKFYLDQLTESLFRLRDQENLVSFIFDRSGKAVKLVYHDKSITSISKD